MYFWLELIKGGLFILIKNGQLLRIVTQSDEELILSEKRTAIIYTDASVKEIGKDKYRSGIGLAVLFRKKRRFGVKLVSDFQIKDSKDDIAEIEYRALMQGIREALCTWGDDIREVYVVSDSTSALKRLTTELQKSDNITFQLKLYWIKGHQKYLLNELVDNLSNNESIVQFSTVDEALVIPDGQPYAEFDGNGYKGGLGRAYNKGAERDRAFSKLLKSRINLSLVDLLK